MILKKIDSVGRLVIPMEIRNTLNWKTNDEIELINQDDKLILKKHYSKLKSCCICNSDKNLQQFKDKFICSNCLKEIQNYY